MATIQATLKLYFWIGIIFSLITMGLFFLLMSENSPLKDEKKLDDVRNDVNRTAEAMGGLRSYALFLCVMSIVGWPYLLAKDLSKKQ